MVKNSNCGVQKLSKKWYITVVKGDSFPIFLWCLNAPNPVRGPWKTTPRFLSHFWNRAELFPIVIPIVMFKWRNQKGKYQFLRIDDSQTLEIEKKINIPIAGNRWHLISQREIYSTAHRRLAYRICILDMSVYRLTTVDINNHRFLVRYA